MSEIRNLLLFVVISGVFAYGALVVFGNMVAAETKQELSRVTVSDKLGPRTHDLSGMVMLPSGCHQLMTKVKELDPQNYVLTFSIWEDPNRTCPQEPTPERFHVTVFAPPTGIAFQAKLDNISVPLTVVPVAQ